jgi:arginyl-tRNA synthetase
MLPLDKAYKGNCQLMSEGKTEDEAKKQSPIILAQNVVETAGDEEVCALEK